MNVNQLPIPKAIGRDNGSNGFFAVDVERDGKQYRIVACESSLQSLGQSLYGPYGYATIYGFRVIRIQ